MHGEHEKANREMLRATGIMKTLSHTMKHRLYGKRAACTLKVGFDLWIKAGMSELMNRMHVVRYSSTPL